VQGFKTVYGPPPKLALSEAEGAVQRSATPRLYSAPWMCASPISLLECFLTNTRLTAVSSESPFTPT